MAKNKSAKTAAAAEPVKTEETTTESSLPTGEATSTEDTGGGDPAPAPKTEAKVALSKLRGPRGVPETAKIKLIIAANPKRPGSKAAVAYACYVDGMTTGEFCDAVDKTTNPDGSSNKGMGTPHLVYDAAHGFISIEGYTPPGGVIVAKPKAEPKPKVVKEKKSKAEGPAADPEAVGTAASEAAAAVEEATSEETVE